MEVFGELKNAYLEKDNAGKTALGAICCGDNITSDVDAALTATPKVTVGNGTDPIRLAAATELSSVNVRLLSAENTISQINAINYLNRFYTDTTGIAPFYHLHGGVIGIYDVVLTGDAPEGGFAYQFPYADTTISFSKTGVYDYWYDLPPSFIGSMLTVGKTYDISLDLLFEVGSAYKSLAFNSSKKFVTSVTDIPSWKVDKELVSTTSRIPVAIRTRLASSIYASGETGATFGLEVPVIQSSQLWTGKQSGIPFASVTKDGTGPLFRYVNGFESRTIRISVPQFAFATYGNESPENVTITMLSPAYILNIYERQ